MIAAIVLLLAQAAPSPAAPSVPPPGLQFGFFRMAAFRQRVIESNCGADLDVMEALRKRLAARFGEKAFAWPKVPTSPPGDCDIVSNVYRVNFTDFQKVAEAALAAPAAVTSPAPIVGNQ